MNAIAFGTTAGVVLAFAALIFGFWGFLLVALFGVIGGVVGGAATGRLNLKAAAEAARGRRVD